MPTSGPGDAPGSSGPAWTVEQAAEYFTQSGVPMRPETLRVFIRELGIPEVGREPSAGPQGGRGKAQYSMRELMELNAALAKWLVRRYGPPREPG